MVTWARRFRRRFIEGSGRISCQKPKIPRYPMLTGRYTCPSDRQRNKKKYEFQINSGAKTTATIAISLIKILSAGPAVSLNGSPTVSPVTAAMCAGEPFPPR